MKFLADMGISPRVVRYLVESGHDALHLHEKGWEKFSDSQILEKARQEKRIVLTHDLDFGDLLAASGNALPSVIIFRLRNMRPGNVSYFLQIIIDQHRMALESGVIISVNERQARVRVLPVVN